MERYYYYVYQWMKDGMTMSSASIMRVNGNFSMKRAIEFQEKSSRGNGFILFWHEISSEDFEYMSDIFSKKD